jgi:signal transduction histidine kinase
VDGFNSQANILEWPAWLAGLSQRRETLNQLALLDAHRLEVLNQLRTNGWRLLAGVVIAAVLLLWLSILRQRRGRRLELEALRLRISRDLHDEIGSSLGSIALISQEAMAAADDPAQVRHELAEIQSIAQQTVDSMRDIVRLVQSETYGQGDLTLHLREIATRMLRNTPHTLELDSGKASQRFPMDQQRDLVLMFKEALNNILRHAKATQVEVTLARRNGSVDLTIHDNGTGFDPAGCNGDGMGLTNLRRRAAKHRGEVRITSAPTRGTTLVITFPLHE